MYKFMPELQERIIVLVKFSDKKWTLESMQKGNLYLNTLEYFRELEKKTMIRGMGDYYEGRLVLADLDMKIYDNETGNLFLTGTSKHSFLTMQEDSEKHVLCTSFIDFRCLEIHEEGKDYFKANVVFTDGQKEEFRKHFGHYALIIFFSNFVENINNSFDNQVIECVTGKVKYSAFSTNYMDRLKPFIENTTDKYLWKDTFFKDQKEYRLILLNRDSSEPLLINVEDMSNYSFITTAEDLFDNRFCIESHFNPQKDLIMLED